jgi:hypothetical protein
MKPGSSRRVRRALLLLGACWLVLSTAWVARRWWAVRILETEAAVEYGTECRWQLAFGKGSSGIEWWARLWPTSHVKEVAIYRRAGFTPGLAWAVRVCGRLEGVSAKAAGPEISGDDREMRALLTALGPQPGVLFLGIEEVEVTDADLAALLPQLPGLRELVLWDTSCTGANFPVMPSLESVGTLRSPISDAGLTALLRQPALKSMVIFSDEVTPAGVLQVSQLRRAGLTEMRVCSERIGQREGQRLEETVRAACPDLVFEIVPP